MPQIPIKSAAGSNSTGSFTGTIAAVSAFLSWGLLPLYWKELQEVNSIEIVLHRFFWAFITTLVLVFFTGQHREILAILRLPKRAFIFLGTALLLAANWCVFIWAVITGHVVESSLGYYINPLFNVFFGFLFFKDRLRPGQTVALLLALCGVINLLVMHGSLPWIALFLASTFALYGLVRKTVQVGALVGLCLECTFIGLPSGGYLLWLWYSGQGVFSTTGMGMDFLLIGTGFVTAFPLVCFAFGARRISMVSLGMLQYIAPTGQFLLGIFAFKEPFSLAYFISFLFIWAGVAVFSIEGMMLYSRTVKKQV